MTSKIRAPGTSPARRTPQASKRPDGSYLLNVPAMVRLTYEADLDDIQAGPKRERVRTFQHRVSVHLEARRLATGQEPDLQEELGRLVDMDRMEAILRRGDLDRALDVMLEPGAVA